jgi:4-amino-4-deoxy-L-arabinose transferase-like glycosyltransferase
MSVSESSGRRWGVILCFTVVAAMALRAYWGAGLIPKDDAEYARVAYHMWQGQFDHKSYDGPPVIPLRVGIVLPTAAALGLLGPGEVQLAIYPLLTAAAMLVLVYLLTARMFGHRAAAVASIIWAFLPIDLEMATTISPEVQATVFAFIGVYCTYIARSREGIGQRAQLLYGLAGGLAFGAAWLCKESVVYFVPFYLALILFDIRNSRWRQLPTWAGIAAGSLALLIGEMVVYRIVAGEWLYRFSALHRNYELYPEFFFTEGATRFGFEQGTSFWKAVVKRVAIDGPALIFLNLQFLFLPSFGAIAALYGFYRRDGRFYFMAVLLVVLVVMFNGFSASLQHYQPLPLFTRYFYAICVPAVVLTSGMLVTLLPSAGIGSVLRGRPEPAFWGGIMILLLAALIAWSTFRQARDYKGTWSAAEKYLAGVLSPRDRIHTDVLSRNGLEFFWRYPEKMNISVYGEPGKQLAVSCGDYVLRNPSYDLWLSTNRGSWLTMRGFELPAIVRKPPESWRVQWTNQNATLFRVSCGD